MRYSLAVLVVIYCCSEDNILGVSQGFRVLYLYCRSENVLNLYRTKEHFMTICVGTFLNLRSNEITEV